MFAGCSSLIKFELIGTGPLSTLENGKALVRDNTELVAYPSVSGSIVMNTITSISVTAFENCSNLTEVYFQEATNVLQWAFDSCTNLTKVNFPAATDIGMYAFMNCTSLIEASFPVVTKIDGGIFGFSPSYCTSLTKVTLVPISDANFSDYYPLGNLRDVYFGVGGGAGTYTTANPGDNPSWTKKN